MAAGTPARIAARVLKRGVGLHGQPRWVAALTPLSVDGMIVEQRPHHIGIGRTYAVRTGH